MRQACSRFSPARAGLLLSTLLVLGACGGDDGPSGPGGQSYTPPPSNQGDGQTRPPGATSFTCGAADDCAYWYCECADGFVVNSAQCVNGYCMDAASACPEACSYFQHGEWTGAAGGGPGSQPPTDSCGGLGSSDPVCDACGKESCCSESAACGDSPACLDYWDCAVACGGDAGCRAGCDAVYPDGISTYEALESCLVGACRAECS